MTKKMLVTGGAPSNSGGERVTNPRKYVRNNVFGTPPLLGAMLEVGVKRFVFSSAAAT